MYKDEQDTALSLRSPQPSSRKSDPKTKSWVMTESRCTNSLPLEATWHSRKSACVFLFFFFGSDGSGTEYHLCHILWAMAPWVYCFTSLNLCFLEGEDTISKSSEWSGLSYIIYVKCVAQGPAHSRCSMTGSCNYYSYWPARTERSLEARTE